MRRGGRRSGIVPRNKPYGMDYEEKISPCPAAASRGPAMALGDASPSRQSTIPILAWRLGRLLDQRDVISREDLHDFVVMRGDPIIERLLPLFFALP